MSVLGGGLRSLNVRVGDVVVRLPHDVSQLAKEAAAMRSAAGAARVPRVLAESAGALVLEHVPHQELPANADAGERVGAAAAAIHRHRFAASGMLDARLAVLSPFTTAYDGLRAWVDGVIDRTVAPALGELAAPVQRLWDAQADRLRSEPPVLAHADFKPANVKWLAERSEVLVLDWEFAWAGPALMDLGQMVRWDPPEEFVAGLERGYRAAGGPLPTDWRRVAEVLDLFNLVAMLEGDDERRRSDLRGRIRATLART
jgi:Ser/Thr protein kinase RdoA (MazF antagonist)